MEILYGALELDLTRSLKELSLCIVDGKLV